MSNRYVVRVDNPIIAMFYEMKMREELISAHLLFLLDCILVKQNKKNPNNPHCCLSNFDLCNRKLFGRNKCHEYIKRTNFLCWCHEIHVTGQFLS